MLSSGTRLGPYEIVAPIGAGGMGEVYKAHDTRLGRDVAIKILPVELAQNARFRSRFEREAKTISKLSHPNICTLFDVGEAVISGAPAPSPAAAAEGRGAPQSTVSYIVMELLDGESLADRVAHGPLALSEVLKYGVQIAEALGKAHREGVIHRDLKPGNIMITKSGAKLLDFGLAKSMLVTGTPEGATAQRPLTEEGTILGTFQYMAPEQLAGEEPDARTDIFALGAVLYEMATGKRAFEGKTKTSLIGAIVSGEPKPMAELQPLTPPALEHVVKKCLAKDPDDRWQNATDIAEELRWISQAGSQAGVAAPVTIRRRVRERFAWSVASVAILAVVVIAPLYWRAVTRKPELLHLTMSFPPDMGIGLITLSPDGKRVAMASNGKIWLRPLDSGDAVPLAGTEGAWLTLFWSPDGKFIAFNADKKLKKVPIDGGPPQTICDAKDIRGGAWGPDGTIVFAPDIYSPIYKVSASGGTPVAVTALSKNESTNRWPFFLPDGRHFLYTSDSKRSDGSERLTIMGASVDSPGAKLIVDDAAFGFFVEPGYLLFAREESPNSDAAALMAVRFDPKQMKTSGDPVGLPIGRISYGVGLNFVAATASVNGTLLYQEWTPPPKAQLRWVDSEGKALALEEQPANYGGVTPALSPDGKRIALVRDNDLWIHDVGAPTSSRITFDHLPFNADPRWSPDGKRLYYVPVNNLTETKLFAKSVTQEGKPEEIFQGTVLQGFDISPDGRFVLVSQQSANTGLDIMMVELATHHVAPFLRTPLEEGFPAFSPDGKWVAYNSGDSVMVRRFPDDGQQWEVTDSGGGPHWSRDGHSILYFKDGTLMRVPVKLGATFEAGAPQKLFACDGYAGQSPDGKRFLILTNEKTNANNSLQVIVNWPRLMEGK